MNTATVTANSVHISENGVIKTGAITFSAGNQAVLSTPNAPFAAGALIQVWFTSAAQDASGNAIYDFYTSFTIQGAGARDSGDYGLRIGQIQLQHHRKLPCESGNRSSVLRSVLHPATVTNGSFIVTANSSTSRIGTAIAGALSFLSREYPGSVHAQFRSHTGPIRLR